LNLGKGLRERVGGEERKERGLDTRRRPEKGTERSRFRARQNSDLGGGEWRALGRSKGCREGEVWKKGESDKKLWVYVIKRQIKSGPKPAQKKRRTAEKKLQKKKNIKNPWGRAKLRWKES